MKKIMMTGTLDTEENDCFFYEKDGKYFEDKEGEMKETSKLQLALYVSLYWSDTSIQTEVKEENNHFYATMFIPIYEEIFMELYEDGDSEEEAKTKVRSLFDDFLNYYEQYEKNIRRNEIRQLKNMKRFIFLPKKRDDFQDNILERELIYVEDSDLDFRDMAISLGVPKDARADEPVFGYIEDNKLVFFKAFFSKGEKEKFKELVSKYEEEIAEHYHLENYDLYLGMLTHEEYMNATDKPLLDSFLTEDFTAYYAIKKQN